MAQSVKNLSTMRETWVLSLDQEDPLDKRIATTPVFLPGEFHGQRSLVGYSPWDYKELDTTEWLTHTHTHTHKERNDNSLEEEGNGNPLTILAWRIPETEEPGGLPCVGLHRVGHDWCDLAAAAAASSVHRVCAIATNSTPGLNFLFCTLFSLH